MGLHKANTNWAQSGSKKIMKRTHKKQDNKLVHATALRRGIRKSMRHKPQVGVVAGFPWNTSTPKTKKQKPEVEVVAGSPWQTSTPKTKILMDSDDVLDSSALGNSILMANDDGLDSSALGNSILTANDVDWAPSSPILSGHANDWEPSSPKQKPEVEVVAGSPWQTSTPKTKVQQNSSTLNKNILFYTNKIAITHGDKIKDVTLFYPTLRHILNSNPGCIEWLFPLREKATTPGAQPLQQHEIDYMKNSPEVLKRIKKLYGMTLQYYGMDLDYKRGTVKRSDDYFDGYRRLNNSSRDRSTITRILKFLGEVDLVDLRKNLFDFLADEIFYEEKTPLAKCRESWLHYWCKTQN